MKLNRIWKSVPIVISTPLACVFPITSCSVFANQDWDWLTSTQNNEVINYCLLIGQNDHADSIERTRSTRKALGTYDEAATEKVKNNANIAEPKQGVIEVKDLSGKHSRKFIVNELEHMEQKSLAGATWDPITANNSAGTWIAKHGKNITFFVSNNDSMAEGAYWASNWINGLPIFGYDANSTTIQAIKKGNITGTVDQNASIQCSAVMMMVRNMLEDRDNYWAAGQVSSAECNNYGQTNYSPLHTGFFSDGGAFDQEEYDRQRWGYVNDYYITWNTEIQSGTKRQVLAASTAIASENVDTYLKEDGTPKKPTDLVDEFTHIKSGLTFDKKYNLCHAYNNKAEVYLVSTLRPYFNEYANRLGLNLDIVEGDGTDEAVVLNQIKARHDDAYDAYLINMAKTTSTKTYVTDLAQKAYNMEKAKKTKSPSWSDTGWENFEDRLDTPLIFWNRQPQNSNGEVDTDIMNNKFFKYTYFIGVDAAFGGDIQGELILAEISKWYTNSLKEGKF